MPSKLEEVLSTSSMYTLAPGTWLTREDTSSWNTALLCRSPMPILVNRHCLPRPSMNAVLLLDSSSSSGTCQYPWHRSKDENQRASASCSRQSLICGSGKTS